MKGEKAGNRQKEKLPQAASFAVYIHIPFCEKKCGYCDFISFCDRMELIDSYVDALCREIEYEKTVNEKNGLCRLLAETVFIGGGTPSLLTNAQVSKIFACLDIKPDAEITIEANPNSITAEKLLHWRKLGINRISIGVQSFDDGVLQKLGRIHNSKQAVEAIQTAYRAGFENINIDLMHSVPEAPLNEKILSENLGEVAPLVTHISAYSLIIEPDTPFAGKYTAVCDERSLAEQDIIEKIVKKLGFSKYEVSNFSKPDFECRHNLAYWHPHECDYRGFGLGAHSLVDNKRSSNTGNLDEYLGGNLPQKQNVKKRTETEIITEIIMLGMRTVKGVPLDYLYKKDIEIKRLVGLGLVQISGAHLSATEKGFRVLNKIIETLAP